MTQRPANIWRRNRSRSGARRAPAIPGPKSRAQRPPSRGRLRGRVHDLVGEPGWQRPADAGGHGASSDEAVVPPYDDRQQEAESPEHMRARAGDPDGAGQAQKSGVQHEQPSESDRGRSGTSRWHPPGRGPSPGNHAPGEVAPRTGTAAEHWNVEEDQRMEILVIVALVVIVAAVNVRWWYRRRQGNSPTPEAGTAEGKTRQMNDVHRERRNDES
ncbi:hypothetical protein GS531_06665 [Rhodococcus hoagii]|nr:hypothetical protein [Prescottella equi]